MRGDPRLQIHVVVIEESVSLVSFIGSEEGIFLKTILRKDVEGSPAPMEAVRGLEVQCRNSERQVDARDQDARQEIAVGAAALVGLGGEDQLPLDGESLQAVSEQVVEAVVEAHDLDHGD